MGDERDARRHELGARGVDADVAFVVRAVESERVIGARDLAILHLRLRDGGALVDVVERRRVLLVRLAAREVAQERALADAPRLGADGGVEQRPVEREPELAEQVLERALVERGDLEAQLDEVRPAHRDRAMILGYIAPKRRDESGIVG
jgi:hypothetical protein